MKIVLVTCLLGLVAMANAWDELQPTTLAFVIDTTGSMGREIAQVRRSVRSILNANLHAAQQPFFNYVVAPYNDPYVPRPIVTNNVNAVVNFVARLRPRGGGDCPELAMGGLWNAVRTSNVGSIVFFFSDASAKDYGRWTAVRDLAVRKHITIIFVMTGCCYRRCYGARYDVYKKLAHATKGALYRLPKTRVFFILNFLKAAIKNGLPTLRNLPKTFPELIRNIGKLKNSPCARNPCKGKRGVKCVNTGSSRRCECATPGHIYDERSGCKAKPKPPPPPPVKPPTPPKEPEEPKEPVEPAEPITCVDMNGASHKPGSVYTVDCVTYKCMADGTEKEIKHMCVANGGACKPVGAVWACKDGSTAMTCKCLKDSDGIYTLME